MSFISVIGSNFRFKSIDETAISTAFATQLHVIPWSAMVLKVAIRLASIIREDLPYEYVEHRN